MEVIKRDKTTETFNINKIVNAITKACAANDFKIKDDIKSNMINIIPKQKKISVEKIQDIIEEWLMSKGYYKVAKSFIIYRDKHKSARFIKERLDYMERYSKSSSNAATSSETDSNANVTIKNAANLEGEVYKATNRIIQRNRMKEKLNQMFPDVAQQYETDINNRIIYIHDEASTPVLKPYCMAASLYPLMTEGVGNLDGVTPSAPNDIDSFSGQITNLVFLLSSQVKGAVAIGEYFVALNYYVIKEYGKDWYNKLDEIATTNLCLKEKTLRHNILKAFKQFVWGINQPAGNRSYQSPLKVLAIL